VSIITDISAPLDILDNTELKLANQGLPDGMAHHRFGFA
jgi:hypothetical protein